MLFASIFPRAERVSTFDISAERNVWLQSAPRSFAIVCDYMRLYGNSSLCDRLRTICDPQSSAIVCDYMETSLKGVHLNFLREFHVKFNAKNRYRTKREKPISHESRSDECDIDFSSEILHGIHSSGSEFFLNRIVEGKLNYWAKLNVLCFCKPRHCANDVNPFKVSCQDVANRKQNIFRMKTTFISIS